MTRQLELRTYEDWKHCITVSCGIPLTPAYVEARLAALADSGDYGTQRFVKLWGAAHLTRVQAWFAQASAELGYSAAQQGLVS